MQLATFDTGVFLRDYWQKKPLLIRNPWGGPGGGWENPLEPDELAGLACEAEVESRLIRQVEGNWMLEHGPFAETRFNALDAQPWTLLVQAVDQYVPQVAALMEPFRFIPNWRMDDVMISYATDGGGVGPHYDQYDVFLIQGLGRRRWKVGQICDHASALMPHEDLRLIADFQTAEEWVLEPGDILYLPPCFAHDGVAVGDDCMTYSIGFRAPARHELIEGWAEELTECLPEEDRYNDPDIAMQANPGEITPQALDRLYAMMTQALNDKAGFARWFGRYTSTPKYADADWRPEEELTRDEIQALLAAGVSLIRNPASRFSFIEQEAGVTLFADGEAMDVTGEAAHLARQLCAQASFAELPGDMLSSGRSEQEGGQEDALSLLLTLYNRGSVIVADDEEED